MTAKLIDLIYCDELRIGKGVEGDPIRIAYQLFGRDGTLLFQVDSWKEPEHPFVKGHWIASANGNRFMRFDYYEQAH